MGMACGHLITITPISLHVAADVTVEVPSQR